MTQLSFEEWIYDAVILAVYEHKTQQIVASDQLITSIERVLKDVIRDLEPSIRYQITPGPAGQQSLSMWADPADTRLGALVHEPEDVLPANHPAIPRSPAKTRRRRDKKACDYCGAIPGINTPGLYQVISPALPQQRILCAMHASAESGTPGSKVRPV